MMAAGVTDHVWTLQELLMYRVPPRAPENIVSIDEGHQIEFRNRLNRVESEGLLARRGCLARLCGGERGAAGAGGPGSDHSVMDHLVPDRRRPGGCLESSGRRDGQANDVNGNDVNGKER